MTNITVADLDKPTIFKNVKVGQPFIETLSPANYIFHRCNELVNGKKTVNARRLRSGRVVYKFFADLDPVFVKGEAEDEAD